MKLFAIRRKADGAYLPAGHRGKHSWVQPSLTEAPRLFPSFLSASNCLAMWAAGPWVLAKSGGNGYYGDDYEENFETVDPTKYDQPKRVKGDYEVVRVELKIWRKR